MARRGDPGHGGPRYAPAGDAHFVIDAQTAMGTQLDAATCDFWNSLLRHQASARALERRCFASIGAAILPARTRARRTAGVKTSAHARYLVLVDSPSEDPD